MGEDRIGRLHEADPWGIIHGLGLGTKCADENERGVAGVGVGGDSGRNTAVEGSLEMLENSWSCCSQLTSSLHWLRHRPRQQHSHHQRRRGLPSRQVLCRGMSTHLTSFTAFTKLITIFPPCFIIRISHPWHSYPPRHTPPLSNHPP